MLYLRLFKQGLLATIVLSIILGVFYPLVITGFGKLFVPFQANGSLIYNEDNQIIASELIGLNFPRNYFQSRPSANNYDAMNSAGTSLSPTSEKEVDLVKSRIKKLQSIYGKDKKVPADLVFASGSGLDPDISIDAAIYQADYIAKVNHLPKALVLGLIKTNTAHGFLAMPMVNVLKLNLALAHLISSN